MSATVRWLPDEVLAHLREVAGTASPASGPAQEARQLEALPAAISSRYELLEVLGQGGMGTVYRALDRQLGREVALKVVAAPAAGWLDAPEQRLRAEARILARLEHPGLVPVHDLGTLPDGRVFYAMKRVRGRRLDDYARERAAAADGRAELLRVFERICETVAFAHSHGVIHRDLKPENVMVGPFGEVLVLDWGLAKVLAVTGAGTPSAPALAESGAGEPAVGAPAGGAVTSPGAVLGTPGYMAPEQSRGAAASERSDVFALGSILRFLLTGAPQPIATAARAAARASFAAAGNSHAAPKPLQAICAKATAGDPERRYAGAAELAADLGRYLAGSQVEAFPESPARRAARFARRHATPILLLLTYLLMRVVLLFVGRHP
jgi:serine/threonine-protein kinase